MVELVLGIVGALFVFAAYSDVKSRLIPNWVSVLLIGLFCMASAFEPERVKPFDGLLLGAMVLAIGFVLFATGLIGGGDAKLAAAAAPWVGSSHVVEFVVLTALVGGALGLAYVGAGAARTMGSGIMYHVSRLGWESVARSVAKIQDAAGSRGGRGVQALSGVPYGLAIAVSAFACTAHRLLV